MIIFFPPKKPRTSPTCDLGFLSLRDRSRPVSGGANKQQPIMSGWDGVHLQCNYRHLLYVYNFFVLIKSGVSLLERGGEEVLTSPSCSIQNHHTFQSENVVGQEDFLIDE